MRSSHLLLLGLLLWQIACGPVGDDDDANLSGEGETCARTADCQDGLSCVALTCTRVPVDGGNRDAGHLSGLGESCLRSSDCVAGLRCIQQVCAWPSDGGFQDGGSSMDANLDASVRDSSLLDGTVRLDGSPVGGDASVADAGLETDAGQLPDGGTTDASERGDATPTSRREGCADPGPVPRGTGGCCTTSADCTSGLCIRGFCSAVCTLDSHCEVTAPATPFAASVTFHCMAYVDSASRVCIPGSRAPCGSVECRPGESCALTRMLVPDGGSIIEPRCLPDRVAGGRVGEACGANQDCARLDLEGNNCHLGLCRMPCHSSLECPDNGECVPLGIPSADGWGYCLGPRCGEPPTSSDDHCTAGTVCVPSPGEGDTSQWVLRCEAPGNPAGVAGSSCQPGNPATCDHRLCVAETCTRLCTTDSDCPEATPYCSEQPLEDGGTITVASCVRPPSGAVACRSERDCGIQGCHMLGPHSLYSWCAVGGHSHAGDPLCSPTRTCAVSLACLPDDVDGTMRCTPRLMVGMPCISNQECLSGTCLDRDGMPPGSTDGGAHRQTFCVSRCQTAADCGLGMQCRSRLVAEHDPKISTDDVLQPWCVPLTPPTGGCSSEMYCERGDACDLVTGACFTTTAVAGSACRQDEDCGLDLRCGSPSGQQGVCIRDGCIPNASNNGCAEKEICVPTSSATAECRRACSNRADCAFVNPDLTCVFPSSADGGFCG